MIVIIAIVLEYQYVFQDRAVKNFGQVHAEFGRRLRTALDKYASPENPQHLKDGGWN